MKKVILTGLVLMLAMACAVYCAGPSGVIIVPFEGGNEDKDLRECIADKVSDVLKNKGFEVIDNKVVEYHHKQSGNRATDGSPDLLGLGRDLNAEYIVTGRLTEARAVKKFKVTALLGGGVILYGTVAAEVKIISTRDGKVVYSNSVEESAKKQLLGAIQEKIYVLRTAAKRVGVKLVEGFNK